MTTTAPEHARPPQTAAQAQGGAGGRWARVQRYRARHPERHQARKRLRRAILVGALQRGPCERCGATPTDGHHPDYDRPLEVVWLCGPCHVDAHLWLRFVEALGWEP